MWSFFSRSRANHRRAHQGSSFRLGCENLESRRLLAGDVMMSITVDGDLILDGDSAANEFVVERQFSGVMRVLGVNTNIIFNGMSASSHSFTMTDPMGIDRDVLIDAGGGNDIVTFDGLNVGRLFQVILGDGDDQISIDTADMASHASVSAGTGADSITVMSSDISGDTNLIGSAGDDTVFLDSLFLGGNFTFNGGGDNDTIDAYFLEEYGSAAPIAIDFLGGAGDDVMTMTGTIGGSMLLDGGTGDDQITNAESELTGGLVIEGGAGSESVNVTDGIISGDLYIHVRDGVAAVTEPISITNTTIVGRTDVRGSVGDQHVSMSGNTLDRLFIVLGGGNDQAIVSNNTVGKADIKAGSGADIITLSANSFGDRLLIDAGGGIDTISTASSDVFSFFVDISGGLNHNDVGIFGLNFLAGASITSIENMTLRDPTP